MRKKIAIIGLGYVGLPLAVEFGKKREVIGFDIDKDRIKDLNKGFDSTLETTRKELNESHLLSFTSNAEDIEDSTIFIITVPTPIDSQNKPDLEPLRKSSKTVGKALKKGDIVIYESTVFPGATEEVCVPILEKESGLRFNDDFFCGYSPERINPGDKKHRLIDIKKVTSGSTPKISKEVDNLYKEIITAGTYNAESIKVAEAAKVIENTQRDVNIALINELALIFDRLDIDTESVLDAASTKWNFLPFRPGLVGGHCIGVDPYYLTHKAVEVGYNPEIILAGRKLNDQMSSNVVMQVIKLMNKKGVRLESAKILVMGLTFKENCPDLRNTKVVDLIKEFKNLKCNVDVCDPWADKELSFLEYKIDLIEEPKKNNYDAIILAVGHEKFKSLSSQEFRSYGKELHVLYDIKHLLRKDESDGRL